MIHIGDSEKGFELVIGSNMFCKATRGFFRCGFKDDEDWSPKYIGLDFYFFFLELAWPLSEWTERQDKNGSL
jgi:hypothetical protein